MIARIALLSRQMAMTDPAFLTAHAPVVCRERPPGHAAAANCAHDPGGLALSRPFGPPSPEGRGKFEAASGRRFMESV